MIVNTANTQLRLPIENTDARGCIASEAIRVLLVESNPEDARRLCELLGQASRQFDIVEVARLHEALGCLESQTFDAVVLDLSLSDSEGPEAVLHVGTCAEELPIVVIARVEDETMATEALHNGAQDYLIKSQLDPRLLERSVCYAIERYRAAKRAHRHAYYDRLTHFPNRALLYDRLQQAIFSARRDNAAIALLMLDLDGFKEINEAFSRQFGDLLLRDVALRLKRKLRQADAVARMGDQFAVLIPARTSSENAVEVARRILHALDRSFAIDGLKVNLSGSIGIAVFPDHGADADILMRRAELAMYVAKDARRGYAMYSAEHDRSSSRRLEMMGELRRAIAEDQLMLLYQPKLDLKTGQTGCVEALVRWRHPDSAIIPPDEFIPMAERTGLIRPLTLWVLKEALSQCRAWHRSGLDLRVGVNLSRRNLQAQDLPEQIGAMLQACGVTADYLEVEITESAIMPNMERAAEVLSRIRNMGVRVALDDFGTGYSSLAYLKNLPVDEIKVDKSFVMNMHQDDEDIAIVRLIIDMAHILGLKVVAEGVENREAKGRLIALGCDAAQGYYISRPVAADELARKLLLSPTCFDGDRPGRHLM